MKSSTRIARLMGPVELWSRAKVRVAAASLIMCAAAPSLAADLTPQEAKKVAVDAYIYGYSLMTSDVTEKAFTNTIAPNPQTFQAPLNQFVSLPKYPPADYKGVTAPNADTLYSGAFIDVSKEPIILSYPDMHGRYFLFPIYSKWTNVIAAPGKRTLGTGAQTIAITGPNWRGSLPSGVTQEAKSPTNTAFVIGRVYADGTPADYAEVNAAQMEFKLVPLSSYGKPYTPPAGTIDPTAPSVKDKVRDIIGAMDTQTHFQRSGPVDGRQSAGLASGRAHRRGNGEDWPCARQAIRSEQAASRGSSGAG
jgi:hypothetical protein